jgi:hypothetical protein
VTVLIEKGCTFLCVLPGLDRTQFGGPFIENHCIDVLFVEDTKNILASLRDEAVREKIPVTNDHA